MKLTVVITLSLLMLVGPSSAWAVCDAEQSNLIPTTRYEINGDVVYDKMTNLTWQRCSYGQHWKEDRCVGVVQIETADQMQRWNYRKPSTEWRMPSTDELNTLVSPACQPPYVNQEAFPNMDHRRLTYGSNNANGSASRDTAFYYVFFGDRTNNAYENINGAAVRLVRDTR